MCLPLLKLGGLKPGPCLPFVVATDAIQLLTSSRHMFLQALFSQVSRKPVNKESFELSVFYNHSGLVTLPLG